MNFNHFRKAIEEYEKILDYQATGSLPSHPAKDDSLPDPPKANQHRVDRVAGGTISWKPIDKQAAMLLARCNWLSKPDIFPKPQPTKTKPTKGKTVMKPVKESGGVIYNNTPPPNRPYLSDSGMKIVMKNGEAFVDEDDFMRVFMQEIEKLHVLTAPTVLQAQQARKIVAELLDGLGSEFDRFKANSNQYVTDVRQSRFAIVTEISGIVNALRDVRQFFLESTYEEQMKRLREFIELCERLQTLKNSGFLDLVADTMLRLSVPAH